MIQQVNNEVSSNFTKFADPKYKKNPIVNFKVISTDKEFLYQYQHNPKLKLPKPIEIDVPNKYMTKKLLKPSQTNFNFEQIDEETTQHPQPITEEQNMRENSPLFEDIIAADKINDPIQQILDIYYNIKLHNLDNFNISSIRDNKKITIQISNI